MRMVNKQPVHESVVALGQQAFRPDQIAAHQQPAQHEDGHQPGQIEGEGKQFVKGSLEKLDAEKQIGKIRLGDNQRGADNENEKTPEKEGMRCSGTWNPEHLGLQEHRLDQVFDPFASLVGPVQRLPEAVDLDPL